VKTNGFYCPYSFVSCNLRKLLAHSYGANPVLSKIPFVTINENNQTFSMLYRSRLV